MHLQTLGRLSRSPTCGAEHHLRAEPQRHRVLQVPAHGQHGRRRRRPQRRSAAARSPGHGGAVAARPGRRWATESSTGRTIGRLCVRITSAIGPSRSMASAVVVAIGSSERLPLVQTIGRPTPIHQQMVQRRVGQHDAQVRIARRDRRRRTVRVAGEPPQQHDGRSGATRARRPPRPRPRSTAAPSSSDASITANGLSGRCLRRRSRATASAFVASTINWKPPRPLSATIRPARTARDRAGQGLLAPGQLAAGGVQQPQLGTATRAGDRLGVKTPVGRVVVFRPAGRTHRKAGHRRPRPVVGQALDDRPPRAAVRAVGERIVVPPLPGVWISARHAAQVARSAGIVGRGAA